MKNKKAAKGVRFHITREMIREYLKLPIAMRIAWLEEATIFSYYALPPARRRVWDKFRRGEL